MFCLKPTNRRRVTLLFVLLLISIFPSSSQTSDGCGTPKIDSATAVMQPYYNNNQYLLDLVNQVENGGGTFRTSGGPTDAVYQIPVKVWIYDGLSPGQIGLNEQFVESYLRYINRFYRDNGVQIFLYLDCGGITRLTSSYYSGVNESNYNQMFNTNHLIDHLNIHFVGADDGFNRGRFPWINKDKSYACYVAASDFNAYSANVLTHEIGHAFGLLHTHENSRGGSSNNATADGCFQEHVNPNSTLGFCVLHPFNRKRCEINGDMLCDTNADPERKSAEISISGCSPTFIGTNNQYKFDNSGAQWYSGGFDNALRNLMSYTVKSCREEITRMQRGVMYEYVKVRGKPISSQANPVHFYSNIAIDTFENDNYWKPVDFTIRNNRLSLNEIQYHTFHKGSNNTTSCDVDWVYLEAFTTSTYEIKTRAVSGQTQPDTELFLYSVNPGDGALTFITSNRNESGSSTFSKISRLLNPGDYAVRVVNHTPNSVGHYELIYSDQCFDFVNNNFSLTGSSPLCTTNKTFSVNNLIPGATVSWSATPCNLFAVCSGTGSSFVTRAVNSTVIGSGSVKATISYGTCTPPVVLSYTTHVGKPSFAGMLESGQYLAYGTNVNQVCNGVTQRTIITPYGGTTNITWQKVTSSPSTISWSQTGNNLSFYFYTVGQTATFRMNMTNSCGTQSYDFKFSSISCGGGCETYTVSPNPAKSVVSIAIPNIPPPCLSSTSFGETTESSSIDDNTEIHKIIITSLDGQPRIHKEFKESVKDTELDISSLEPGLYVVRIVSKGEKTETHRLIVQ